MTEEGYCSRCSVQRVNALCRQYELAFHRNDADALRKLRAIVALCRSKGYRNGAAVLQPGLSEREVRPVFWNISSFLTDRDVLRIVGTL